MCVLVCVHVCVCVCVSVVCVCVCVCAVCTLTEYALSYITVHSAAYTHVAVAKSLAISTVH